MAGPMAGESYADFKARRAAEMAHENGTGPAPTASSFEAKKAHVAAQQAARSARPAGGGRAINLDRAAEVEDEAQHARNHGTRGGVKPLDMEAIKAADAELAGKKGAELNAIGEERENAARAVGRSRFDIDKPVTQAAVSQSPQLSRAPRAAGTAPKGTARPAPVVARKAPASAPAATTGTNTAGQRVAPAVQSQLPRQAHIGMPSMREGTVSNPAPMAPTPHESTTREGDEAIGRSAGPPPPTVNDGTQRQRYGRAEANGQGTLFGTSAYKGKAADRKQAGRGLSFGEGAGATESPSGPIKGEQAMLTPKGNPTQAARNPNYVAPKPTPSRAPASKPAVAQVEAPRSAPEAAPEPEFTRPRAAPARPDASGVGDVHRVEEVTPDHGDLTVDAHESPYSQIHEDPVPAKPAGPAPASASRGSESPVITRRDTPRPEGRTGAGGRGVWASPGVERTTLNGAQAAHAEAPAPSAPAVGSVSGDSVANAGPAPAAPETITPATGRSRPGGGRTAVSTPRDSSPARGGVHIEGDSNIVGNNSGNTTHNTYNYHIGGDVHGNVGSGGSGGGGRVPRTGGSAGGPRGRAAGGRERETRPDRADIWVRDVNGTHSARAGWETITGQRNGSGELTHAAREHQRSQATAGRPAHRGASMGGGQQQPLAGSGRASGGTSGTGTNFNWGPAPGTQTASSGGPSGPSFASGNGGYGIPRPSGSRFGGSGNGTSSPWGNGSAASQAPDRDVTNGGRRTAGGLNWDEN